MAQQQRIGAEQAQEVWFETRQQPGLNLRRTQRIEPDDLEGVAAPGERDFDFERGAGGKDLRQARQFRIERFVKARARTADDEIGLACEAVNGEAEFVERAGVDEMHRHTERHAEGDAEQREHGPPRIAAQRVSRYRVEHGSQGKRRHHRCGRRPSAPST